MNPDKKYSKMNYEVEIKRLEKRIDDLDKNLTGAFIIIIWAVACFVLGSLGGRSY